MMEPGKPGLENRQGVPWGARQVWLLLNRGRLRDSHGHGHRLPPYARTDRALRGAADLLRRLHAVASGFQPAITSYRNHPRPPGTGKMISHGDLGPWNTVYHHGMPVAVIDWDSTGPVSPLADLADRGPSCLWPRPGS
jgi:hypothetical protein